MGTGGGERKERERGHALIPLILCLLSTAAQYLSTDDRTIRKAALANLTQTSLSRPKTNDILKEVAKDVAVQTPFVCLGKHRWRAGRKLADHLDLTGSFPESTYSNVLADEDGFFMCDFIQDICKLGWKPNHIHSYECGGMEHANPRLLRDIKPYRLWKLYQQQQDERDAVLKKEAEEAAKLSKDEDLAPAPKRKWRPGRGTFLLLLDHLTVEIKDKSCLSYYYVRLVQCFDDQVKFIDYLIDIVKAGDQEWESIHGMKDRCPAKPEIPPLQVLHRKRREIKEVFSFAKHHLAKKEGGHLVVGRHDPCRFHCVAHALGGCKEQHPESADCDECGKLHRFGENLSKFHQKWCNLLCRAYENDLPSFRKSSRTKAATEEAQDTLPDYVGRKVKKNFGEGSFYYGVVLATDECAKTKKMIYRVRYSDGDEEDLYTKELVDVLVVQDPSDFVEDVAATGVTGDDPAGLNRRKLYDLVRLAKHNAHVPVNWCSHQARHMHQDFHIDLEVREMQEAVNKDIIRLGIDMKAKTLPSKRSTAQGEGMGLRGMSLAGGQFEHVEVGEDGHAYVERQQIHGIYCHGSKQQHDDTTRGIEAQLQFIASELKRPMRVRLRSDKCNNYCTFSQIPFIIEGNKRGWRRDGDEGPPLLQVVSWIFSEAQCGKDQLDVNFSYVSISFKSSVSRGADLLTGRDMFKVMVFLLSFPPSFPLSFRHTLLPSIPPLLFSLSSFLLSP